MAGEPNFIIVGAPKCGTTTLAEWLSAHPDVFMSGPKEPHYFNFDLANRNIKNWQDYKTLFAKAEAHHRAIGEASTWYLFSEEAVPQIEKTFPGARYIVMTRDPVEMAISLYLHNKRHLHEDAASFEEAWELQEARRGGKCIPETCLEPAFLQYRKVCSLGWQMKRLLAEVNADRVLHVGLWELRKDPAAQYRRILAFLGLQDDGRSDFTKKNEARIPRSYWLQRILMAGGRIRRAIGIWQGLGLLRLNEKGVEKPEISQDFRKKLHSEFEEDMTLLAEASNQLAK